MSSSRPRTADLIVTTDGTMRVWRLDRPGARNALTPSSVSQLHQAMQDAERDGIRSVVIHGSGDGFCAGADLRYLLDCFTAGESPRPFLEQVCDLTVAMEQSPIVFVAAIHGHAVAGGLELALACDVVLATPDALIGDGHVANNLVPGGGSSVRIVDRLGVGTGTWLALSGRLQTAESLSATGWIRTLAPIESLLDEATAAAQALAQVPAAAQARVKRLVRGPAGPVEAALSRELDVFEEHWRTSDVGDHLHRFLHRDRKETRHA